MIRKSLVVAALIAAAAFGATKYVRRGDAAPQVTTGSVSRGSIVKAVSASGSIEAVETVEVGTQVSGSVQSLYADFNSIVRKGQVLARLDPSLIQADITRAQANLQGAEAERDRLTVNLRDAETKVARARELANRQLIATADLEAAEMAVKTSDAQVRSAAAQVTQARAALSQAQVNLSKTVITSPIDGIVISRSVDVGQTVAASLQAPTLFTLAADLSHMQLKASIDESDLGNIRDGQAVSFHVDAYPNDVFNGVVKQIRLNPVVEQNVVTYAAMISAPNPALKLKPGMTANLNVEVARRDDVLRVPAAALRFKPSENALAALAKPDAVAATSGSTAARLVPTAGRPPAPADQGTLWIYENETLRAVPVKIGVSDGTFTEIVEGDVDEGTTLATRVTFPGSATSSSAPSGNPLLGPSGPRRL